MESKVVRSQPQLKEGINKVESPEGLPIFQSLLSTHLEGRNASAVWIDTGNESSTYALNSYSPCLMDKVWIGRAFTPFQHHQLVQNLDEFIKDNTEILVLPNISMMYTNGQISEWEARELFKETWKKIREIQEEENLKVAISSENFSEIIEPDVNHNLNVEKTIQGLKYSGERDQLSYSQGNSSQTTLSYWREKSKSRAKLKV